MCIDIKYMEQLYSKHNNKCFIKNGYIILNNMFIVHVHKSEDKMSHDDIVLAFTKMEKLKLDFKCNQYIIISKNGYVGDVNSFTELNIRLEDISYINELEDYLGDNYNELLCHNKVATKFVEDSFEKGNNLACVVQPTGSGKSYIIQNVLYGLKFKFERKVVVAPNIYIIDQIKSTCSSYGIDEEIKFITYSKIAMMTSSEILALKPDILVLDEFHRAGASSWEKGVYKLLDSYKDMKVFGTTATEIRYLDKKRDMSLEIFKGNVHNELSLLSAISRKILPLPKYVTAQYTMESDINELIAKISEKKLPYDMRKKVYEDIEKFKFAYDTKNYMINILKKHITDDMNKFIVFCKNDVHLITMRTLFKDWFKKAMPNRKLNIYSVISSNSNSLKEFEDFRESTDINSINLLFSINQITEGIHIKVSGVFLCRPTISPILYYQQIGRTMSTNFDGNPLIFDLVNNNESINNNMFRTDLISEFKRTNIEHTRLTGKHRDLDYLKEIDALMIDETKDFRNLIERNRVFLSETWMDMFLKLKKYYKEHRTFSMKSDKETAEKYQGLKSFISRMRTEYYDNILEQSKIDQLNSISFTWDMREDRWLNKYEELLKYAIEGYDGDKPIYSKCWIVPTVSDPVLNRWVEKQRSLYKRGKLSDKRISMLEDINMTWDLNRKTDRDRLEMLRDYKEKFGHIEITRANEEYLDLALWMSKFRTKKKKGLISDEDILFADEIGFIWSLKEVNWNKSFELFKKYCDDNNAINNYGIAKLENKLKAWIYRTKKDYESGNLPEESIEKIKENKFEIFFGI